MEAGDVSSAPLRPHGHPPGVSAQPSHVLLNPEQSSPLVLQAVVTWQGGACTHTHANTHTLQMHLIINASDTYVCLGMSCVCDAFMLCVRVFVCVCPFFVLSQRCLPGVCCYSDSFHPAPPVGGLYHTTFDVLRASGGVVQTLNSPSRPLLTDGQRTPPTRTLPPSPP